MILFVEEIIGFSSEELYKVQFVAVFGICKWHPSYSFSQLYFHAQICTK